MTDICKQAVEIHKATGKPYRQVFEALRNNPPQQQTATTATVAKPSAPNFMDLCAEYKLRNKCSFKDAYLAVRKQVGEDAFMAWLASVQG
jgi:hypothetical protein